ncbi:MAG: hypothetical protein ACC662_10130 [Planctomycetota bacterium]
MRLQTFVLAFLLLLSGPFVVSGPLSAARAGSTSRARGASLVQAIRTRRVRHASFDKVSLKGFVKWLRTATGFNVVIDYRALAKAGIDPENVTFTAKLDDVTILTLLRLALVPHDLGVVVRGNLVRITTHAASLGKPVTRLYGIADITYQKIDFIAPEINLRPSGDAGFQDYEPERVVEDDPLTSGDAVVELLQEIVSPGEWENPGWSIRATDRYLVVRAPRSVQARIPRALDAIRSLK